MRFLIAIAIVAAGLLSVEAQEGGVAAAPELTAELDVMEIVNQRYPRTVAVLKSDFPGDYATLVADVAAISWRGGSDERSAMLRVFESLKGVREQYAERITHAPSVSHAVMLGLLADFYDNVAAGEGAAVCGRFASDGSAVLFDLGVSEAYAEQLDLQSLAFFDAVVKAIEQPENAGPVQENDWNVVVGAMVAGGAPRSYVDAIAKGDPNNPELCPALAAMFRTSGLLTTPEGARTRADFARNLAGY